MTIKAVTFDFWSTLYKPRTVDYNQRILSLKARVENGSGKSFELEQFSAAVGVARETWVKVWEQEHKTMGATGWLGVMLQELQTSLPADYLDEIALSMEDSVLENLPTLVPDAKTVLAELTQHYKLAIISDTGLTPGKKLRQVLDKDGVTDYFSQLTFSDEVGRSKPHPHVFSVTLNALGVQPHQAAHVGDLLRTDIAGAQQAGMCAVQYIGVSQDTSSTEIVPDEVIENLSDIMLLLQ